MEKARTNDIGEFLGNYPVEWLHNNQDNIINYQLVSEWVMVDPCYSDFVKKLWSGSEWIEGLPVEKINAVNTPKYMARLQTLAARLCDRAEALAIGKEGSKKYIASQRKFYENKYDYAKGSFIDPETEARLAIETEKFNTSYGLNLNVEDFKQIIIYRFDDSKLFYQKYMMMIETGRTTIQTLIENTDWIKADQAFPFYEMLFDASTASETMHNLLTL